MVNTSDGNFHACRIAYRAIDCSDKTICRDGLSREKTGAVNKANISAPGENNPWNHIVEGIIGQGRENQAFANGDGSRVGIHDYVIHWPRGDCNNGGINERAVDRRHNTEAGGCLGREKADRIDRANISAPHESNTGYLIVQHIIGRGRE